MSLFSLKSDGRATLETTGGQSFSLDALAVRYSVSFPEGPTHDHLCSCAPKSHVESVHALAFFSSSVRQFPIALACMADRSTYSKRPAPLLSVSWPTSLDERQADRIVVEPSGVVTVTSLDDNATLSVPPPSRIVHLSYDLPVPLSPVSSQWMQEEEFPYHFYHVRIEQTLLITELPSAFLPALEIALRHHHRMFSLLPRSLLPSTLPASLLPPTVPDYATRLGLPLPPWRHLADTLHSGAAVLRTDFATAWITTECIDVLRSDGVHYSIVDHQLVTYPVDWIQPYDFSISTVMAAKLSVGLDALLQACLDVQKELIQSDALISSVSSVAYMPSQRSTFTDSSSSIIGSLPSLYDVHIVDKGFGTFRGYFGDGSMLDLNVRSNIFTIDGVERSADEPGDYSRKLESMLSSISDSASFQRFDDSSIFATESSTANQQVADYDSSLLPDEPDLAEKVRRYLAAS